MIFHDRVDITYTVEGPPDPFGSPTTIDVTVTDVPAEVFSLDSDLALDGTRATVVNRYRMVIHPKADIPAVSLPNEVRIQWGPYPELVVDGAVERHVIRGRLHHYEVICKSVVG